MPCADRFVDVPREPPGRIEIHLGTRCNNRCIFCMSSDRRDMREPWATLERIKAELDHFFKKGCRMVGFLGGEPTVHPDIIESIAYAKSLGFERIAICTDGTRLSDMALCRKLVDAGVTRVTISVHSHLPEVEDALITRVPGNHAKKVAAIRNLRALRGEGRLPDNVSLNPVLCRRNMRELKEYVLFFGGLGVDDVRFNFIWPHGEVPRDRDWIPSYREAMPHVARMMLLCERSLKAHVTFGAVPKCMLRLAKVSSKLLEYLGAKYLDEAVFDPSNDVSMANLEGRPQDRFVWQEVKRDVFKTMSPKCRGCRFYAGCDGVWKSYAELYGLGELDPL
ncbi:MAG: radical SAM protein [Elusimicrobia bacterium]|nr:radical SAM protein [Elusimicrobiota bacterium]